jgi:hypothetical protein
MSETKIEVTNSSGAASLYAALAPNKDSGFDSILIGKTRKSDKLNASLIGFTHAQAEEFAWGILDLLYEAGYYKFEDICKECDGPLPKDSAGRLG